MMLSLLTYSMIILATARVLIQTQQILDRVSHTSDPYCASDYPYRNGTKNGGEHQRTPKVLVPYPSSLSRHHGTLGVKSSTIHKAEQR
jgi:hypothetical protein